MSKLISKLIKKTISCVFILLTLSLFITCDDPNNPFSNPFTNNLGEKVVVEPPTIYVTDPSNNSFIKKDDSGFATIYGYAKAYVKVERVEWKVFANKMYDQPETEWSTEGITYNGNTKEWNWIFTFDPDDFNDKRDGYITMQFRVWDSRTPKDSIKYIFKVKTKPSEINMTVPAATVILRDESTHDDKGVGKSPSASKIYWKGDISGQVIDVKGLRPGYPQIQIWPAKTNTTFKTTTFTYDPEHPEMFEDDVNWGWASLYLPGVGKGEPGAGGEDNIDIRGSDTFLGTYAARENMRVVNTASFSFRLAEFTIDVDLTNPDWRRIRYIPDASGAFQYYNSGMEFYFRIRTEDVEPNPAGETPVLKDSAGDRLDGIKGFFPASGFQFEDPKETRVDLGDTFYPRRVDDTVKKLPEELAKPYSGNDIIKPIKITIHAADAKPLIDLINGDELDTKPEGYRANIAKYNTNITDFDGNLLDPYIDANKILNDNTNKPNPFITELTSKKIAIYNGPNDTPTIKSGRMDFRLRLKVIQLNGIEEAKLEWKHEATGRNGTLARYVAPGAVGYDTPILWNDRDGEELVPGDKTKGLIFSYVAKEGPGYPMVGGKPIFYSHSEPYILTLTITAPDKTEEVRTYVLYMDGENPKVSITSVKGSDRQPTSDAEPYNDGLLNASYYAVNGNIQVVVDPTDASGIMPWREGTPGAEPPVNSSDRNEWYGYPMVKWIISGTPTDAPATTPPSADTILTSLTGFKSDPTQAGLKFFYDIEDSPTSGWVRKPFAEVPFSNPPKDATGPDRARHFKINTAGLADKKYYWLYVIAQDGAQNLGFIVQQIYVDQSTDKPVIDTPPLVPTNASGKTILETTDTASMGNLDVTVGVTSANKAPHETGGNWKEDVARKNVLEKNEGIQLNFIDDDGINIDGIEIKLTVLDPVSDVSGDKTVTIHPRPAGTPDDMKLFKGAKTVSKEWSVKLDQNLMAKILYNDPAYKNYLKDGMYKIEFTVKDDPNEKVKITRQANGYPDGRTPPIDGDDPAALPVALEANTKTEATYYFAVYTADPQITIDYPKPDMKAGGKEVPIYGSVKSRFKMQNMWISFDPGATTKFFTTTNNAIIINGTSVIIGPEKVPLWGKRENETSQVDGYNTYDYSIPITDLIQSGMTPDADGFYTYYWQVDDVDFNPKDSGGVAALFKDSSRSYTVAAYDRLGNTSSEKQSVVIDSTPPDVKLLDFNHGRLPEARLDSNGDPVLDGEGKPIMDTYLYGKVSFTVSASDDNGLYEVEKNGVMMSGIKWWVMKEGDQTPTWETPGTTYTTWSDKPGISSIYNSWNGFGNFRYDPASGGRYTGIIDTRWLQKGVDYYLCIIAMDNAGNTSYRTARIGGVDKDVVWYETFKVDQDRDYPFVADENLISPLPDSVVGTEKLIISGAISDLDRFDPKKTKTYVQIRIPRANFTGAPAAPGDWSTAWIDIDIPETYSSKEGGIDPSGAIVYKFDPAAGSNDIKTYFDTDGIKYYQIRVFDEPVEGVDKKNFGKNPDDPVRPAYEYPYQYEFHDKVYKIFPDENTGYKFFVDASDPIIFFDKYDPTKESKLKDGNILEHKGYTEFRPTFSKWDDLRDALSGFVKEYKLSTLTMTWIGKNAQLDIMRGDILSNPDDPVSPADEYKWDLTETEFFTGNPSYYATPVDPQKPGLADPKKFFNAAEQGLQIITFEATDMVGRMHRVTYTFNKDTKGPDISFTNIERAIYRRLAKHTNHNVVLGIPTDDLPATVVFPSTSNGYSDWSSDWPYGDAWKTAWAGFWKDIKDNWPSEYAFRNAAAVIASLKAEDDRKASTVIGDSEKMGEQLGYKDPYAPPVITGTFSDDYSSIRILLPANNPDPTYFYYRFKNSNGDLLDISKVSAEKKATFPTPDFPTVSGTWLKEELQPARNGQNEKSADWKITLDNNNGFTGTDGENWVDIWVEDTAHNISEIFNVRFVVDRTAPILGEEPNPVEKEENGDPEPGRQLSDADEFKVQRITGYTPTWTPKWLPEMQRVFSAAGTGITSAEVFAIRGTVSDFNFNSLTITLGQDSSSATSYSITAKLVIKPPVATGDTTFGVDASASDPKGRLSIVSMGTASDGTTPQWTWEFKVLEDDVNQLRTTAGADKDSARRYIRVQATDLAQKRVGPVDWFFYLDTERPKLEYTNLEKGGKGDCESFENERFGLYGSVEDDTRIKDVQFMIGRWDYSDDKWKWYDSAATGDNKWTLTTPPPAPSGTGTNPKTWPSAFTGPNDPKRATTMNWTINQAALTKANADAVTASKAKPFPDNLFDNEGFYRLDLYITDFSLGNGNPHYTWHTGDTFMDTTNDYMDSTNTTRQKSGRVFYIDKKDPTLQWGWVDWNPATNKWVPDTSDPVNANKTYFKSETNGQVRFSFTTGDGNTISKWEAEVTGADGTTLNKQISGQTDKDWTAGVGFPSPAVDTTITSRPIPIPTKEGASSGTTNTEFSTTAINDQKLIIAPFMTVNGDTGGQAAALDVVLKTLPTYTIKITVWDGAGRSNSIQKQFTLDNTPPVFVQEKYQPPSYKYKDYNNPADSDVIEPGPTPPRVERHYSYDAVAGKLTIRGNTTDNSNQITKIAFYVPQAGKAGTPPEYDAAFNFKNPDDPTIKDAPSSAGDEEFWHWQDPTSTATANRYKIEVGGTTILEIDGTFAWRVNAPKTSMFLSNAGAQKYVQWTTTKGTGLDELEYPGGSYRDVTINPTTLAATTTTIAVPRLTFPDLADKKIYGGEDVGLITVYVLAEDAAGNRAYDVLKYWIWPEGDRPIVTAINNPDSTKIKAERLLNGTIRLSGMAKDNERVRYVWFRVLEVTANDTATGKPTAGKPYELEIPVWNEETWDPATPAATQTPKDLDADHLGNRRSKEPASIAGTNTGGWYMANGGNSKDVSWWAYINTKGELDPQGTASEKEFVVEVRAQDTTYDDIQGQWLSYANSPTPVPPNYSAPTSGYYGLASAPMSTSAWVVAGAPIFEKAFVAPTDSKTAETAEIPPPAPPTPNPNRIWDSIDNLNIRNRSAYKVTVKHNSGISSIRWSPTFWNKTLNANVGGFQANPNLDTRNLMELDTNPADPEYFYVYRTGPEAYATAKAKWSDFSGDMKDLTKTGDAIPRMAVTVKPYGLKTGSGQSFDMSKNYLILNWDTDLISILPTTITNDKSYYEDPETQLKLKNLKNTIFKPKSSTGSIGKAVIIEAVTEGSIDYFKWDVIVEVRADLLAADMVKDDPNYGRLNAQGLPDPLNEERKNQTRGSVRYPVYLSASEVSRATPLTSRGDALLPIDQNPPKGMYTLNRKPAGSAATIGGEAGDDGPVNGVARVVLWFQRGADGVSWREHAEATIVPFEQYSSGGPTWWQEFTIPAVAVTAGAKKPALGAAGTGSGGNSAIVIDTNSPSKGIPNWGHTLPMGFADGGMGKYWYVEIDTTKIESGPIDLHYVVIDKAGNYKYYKERLVIMNNVAVIDRIKLATDIRHNTAFGTLWPTSRGQRGGVKIDDKAESITPTQWPILQNIRTSVPLGGDSTDIRNDIKKGISDWIYSSGMSPDKVIDFNVRNNLFALRVETTKEPGAGKSRNFRLEYVNSARLMTSGTPGPGQGQLTEMKAGRVYVINNPGDAKWGALGADGDGPWPRGYAFIAVINGQEPDENGTPVDKISGTGSAWELNPNYYPATSAKRDDARIPTALKLADVEYPLIGTAADPTAQSAEFVYANGAFNVSTTATQTPDTIHDYNGPDNGRTDIAFPPAPDTNYTNWTTWTNDDYSLFILRVFDGKEEDIFGDFKIIRVRVNNNDRSLPFAQVYDINPKTEGQDRSNIAQTGVQDDLVKEEARYLAPMIIGEGTGSNRTRGGLWNIAPTLGSVEKPGHIEPRRITQYSSYNHSLTSAQMGGAANAAAGTMQKPWANPAGFFTTDTVSGRVVLRGYAEDDQRVQEIAITIGTAPEIVILQYQPNGPGVEDTPANRENYKPPQTGLLQIPTALAGNPTANPPVRPRVYFTDSIDLYRHRVEWAYVWDTEAIPNTVVGDTVTVRVRSFNRNGATGTTRKDPSGGTAGIPAPGTGHSNTAEPTRPNTSPYNPGFPAGMYKYDTISFNLRPYITGFRRNRTLFSHDIRSRQGRYMFYRGEAAVVEGFNLGTGTISIPGAANLATSNADTGGTTLADFGITTANNQRYRKFTIPNSTTDTGPVTGNGVVTYSFNSRNAVNTGSGADSTTERRITAATNTTPIRPTYIQPWNIEYSKGKEGSELWDDFTQLHIWQSEEDSNGANRGRFPKGGDNLEVFDPAMSINQATGELWESHNEGGGGGGNTGTTKVSNNNGVASYEIARFIDPITNSDIFISPRSSGGSGQNNNQFTVWSVSSIIGKPGGGMRWDYFGGIWINGPSGGNVGHTSGVATTNDGGFNPANAVAGRSQYHGESTFYNSYPNNNPNLPASGVPALNQFKNPHIVTDYRGNQENIHVSYYDSKDGSMKYRFNVRQTPGTITGTGDNGNSQALNNVPRAWTNLDGGFDNEDINPASNAGTFGNPSVTISGTGTRIVDYSTRSGVAAANRPNTGEYNSIAVTSDGYPVVAYYDMTNEVLKLALSNNAVPILGVNWKIIRAAGNAANEPGIIPKGNDNYTGTGQYVSIKIDTRTGTNPNLNRIHIAAMNSSNKSLVYISGYANFTSGTFGGNTNGTGDPIVQVVDSVGSVGRWCSLSLDSEGDPWISYQDEGYQGARDGIKLAYRKASTYWKGSQTSYSAYRGTVAWPANEPVDIDLWGTNITGWEAMHVPTRFRVENARVGMECYPTRNYTGTLNPTTRFWTGAVGFLGQDYFRAAYYVR
jgi:hypothetical protein